MAARHMRRVKALIRPSGIFDEIRPMDEMYGTSEKFIKNAVLSRCDKIIKNLENAISGKKLDLKNVLIELGSLIHIINEYYMYAKTKVCFAGSYKPAFDIFEREGIP